MLLLFLNLRSHERHHTGMRKSVTANTQTHHGDASYVHMVETLYLQHTTVAGKAWRWMWLHLIGVSGILVRWIFKI